MNRPRHTFRLRFMRCLYLLCGLILSLSGCGNQQKKQLFSTQGSALGTIYEVMYAGEKADNRLPQEIHDLLKRYEQQYSIFDTTSYLSALNRNLTDTLSADMETIINKALEISKLTGGLLDITAAPLVELWGFGRSKASVTQEKIDSLLAFVGYRKIQVNAHRLVKEDPRIQLNLNAIAKGFIVDQVAAYMREKHPDFLVNIGGEIVCEGTKPNGEPWIIGIQTPNTDPGGQDIYYRFSLDSHQAIATSGDYHRFHTDEQGNRYTHIVHPITGQAEKSDLLSVSVIAPDCMTADALATAFMIMGKEKAFALIDQLPGFSACFIQYQDSCFRSYQTAGFPVQK